MDNIILPESGSVVVIDDQINEALPIIKLLSQKGIALTYYSGTNDNELPSSPVQKIRIVFLDLQLFPSNDPHAIATNLVSKLKKIIGPENGPYLLIIWSQKRSLYAGQLRIEINKPEHNIIPASILEFDKSDCLREVSAEENFVEIISDLEDKLKVRFRDDEVQFIANSLKEVIDEKSAIDITYEANENAFSIIEKNIKDKLLAAGSVHLFVLWENILNRSAGEMIFQIASTVRMDNHWEGNMRSIFYQMGKARVNKSENNDVKILRESIKTFNYSFIDSVDKAISTANFPHNIKLDNPFLLTIEKDGESYSLKRNEKHKYSVVKNYQDVTGNENEDISKIYNSLKSPEKERCEFLHKEYESINPMINTKLHIETTPSNELYPGNIYEIDVPAYKKAKYLETYLEKITGDINNYRFIELEVSPICDFAQEKWEKSRRVSGLLIPLEYFSKKERKSGDNFYDVIPSFQLDNSIYKIVFNQRLFKSLDLNHAKEKPPIYRIKRELLLDIIAHLSSHINRPGIMFVE